MLTICREAEEYAPIDETYNPSIHRINHAIKQRAVHPEEPVAETPAELLKFSAPPEYLIEKVRGQIDVLIDAAEVKKGMVQSVICFGAMLTCSSATKGKGQTASGGRQAHIRPGCGRPARRREKRASISGKSGPRFQESTCCGGGGRGD